MDINSLMAGLITNFLTGLKRDRKIHQSIHAFQVETEKNRQQRVSLYGANVKNFQKAMGQVDPSVSFLMENKTLLIK